MTNAIWNIASVIIGGLITAFASWWFYIRASRDLKKETEKIRNLLRVVLVALEDEKMVKLTRNSSGEIIGLAHDAKMSGRLPSLKGISRLDVIKKDQDTQ